MPNAIDARALLAAARSTSNTEALIRALTVVLDAGDKTGDPAVALRLGLAPDALAQFDAGVQYVADLVTAALRQSLTQTQAAPRP